jgi:hypothetical protein
MAETWRRCSSCKQEIQLGQTYWVCSVSTCNRKRTGLVFCSTDCWDAHLGYVHHRESWAEERTAPSHPEPEAAPAAQAKTERVPRRTVVAPAAPATGPNPELPRDILIVASKLKKYIKARSGMNTSDGVMAALSDDVRRLADRAIERARRAERRTVLDRDCRD